MSLLSAISLRSSWRPALTWCRTLYIRQQRLQVLTEVSRTYSGYDRRYQKDGRTTSSGYRNQTTRKFDGNGKPRSNLPKKLYKDRVITSEDREAEIEDIEMFRNLPESERFGTGVGNFAESTVSEKNVPSKSKKQSVLPQNWTNSFGTMASETEQAKIGKSTLADNERYWDDLEKENIETAHIYNHIRLARYNRRHVPHWYARRIIKLGKEGKVREAIQVFEKWMIARDRVKPTAFEFAVLIKLLAEVGYTEKAFHLYKMMCRMKIYCPDQVYTSLFNACSNSPWPKKALELADILHTQMLLKGVNPNYITYLAMIKAYGINGDLNTAFRLADEAIELNLSEDLLNNLLVACVSDKEAGFRHAIVVWRKFRKLGLQPSLTSYNLLLRAVNECEIGDPKLVNKLLGRAERRKNEYVTENMSHKAIEASPGFNDDSNDKKGRPDDIKSKMGKRELRKSVESFKQIDSLLAKYNWTEEENQTFGEGDLDLSQDYSENSDIDTAGTFKKAELDTTANKEWWQLDVFENLVSNVIVKKPEVYETDIAEVNLPNILDPNESFSSVIRVEAVKQSKDRLALIGGMRGFLNTLKEENVKPDIATYTQLAEVVPQHLEDLLIDEMWANGVRPDICFYNNLIRKSHHRAWKLYSRLKHEELVPDIRTFSCLALACRRRNDGMQLIDDMMAADVMPNKFTMTALLTQSYCNFEYMKDILGKMQELDIKPDIRFIEMIEKKINQAKNRLIEMERNEAQNDHHSVTSFQWRLRGFLQFYDKWAQYNIVEEKEHPWKHYMEKKR